MHRTLIERDDIDAPAAEYIRGTLRREQLLTRRANRWRGVALGMTALLASLAWIAGWQEFQRRQPAQYFAILQTGTGKPVLLMKINVRNQVCVITPISRPEWADRSC
jgi:anti-sigma-K factor RskA